MYVPGNDERKVSKIPSLGADCVCLDCEDGVAVNMKEAARTNIRKILDNQNIDFGKVRSNNTFVIMTRIFVEKKPFTFYSVSSLILSFY